MVYMTYLMRLMKAYLVPQLLQFLDEQIRNGPRDLESASSFLRLYLFLISYCITLKVERLSIAQLHTVLCDRCET